jgi:flagellar motor switch protein FliM
MTTKSPTGYSDEMEALHLTEEEATALTTAAMPDSRPRPRPEATTGTAPGIAKRGPRPNRPPQALSADDILLTEDESAAIAEILRDRDPARGGEGGGGAGGGRAHEPVVLRYDLFAGGSRRGDELPGLQIAHERFAQELTGEFRRTVGAEGMFFSEPVVYSKFASVYGRLQPPVALLLANFVGVGCTAIISLEPALALHFVDLMLGGDGAAVPVPSDFSVRGFTPSERGVLRHIVAVMSRALKTAWSDIGKVGLELQQAAADPRLAAIYEPMEMMAELRVRIEWGTVSGTLAIAIPTGFLGQFEAALSRTSTLHAQGPKGPSGASSADSMRLGLEPVRIDLSAILGRTTLTVERLLSLEVGDVVRLDTDPEEPLELLLEGVPGFLALPTVRRGNIAVSIVDEVAPTASDRATSAEGGRGPLFAGGNDD